MDPLSIQRLQVAQELVQDLLSFLSMPIRPSPASIQAALDMANSKLQIINQQSQAALSQPLTFTPPNLLPPGVTAPPVASPAGTAK